LVASYGTTTSKGVTIIHALDSGCNASLAMKLLISSIS
jgi:hypothetical protein